MNKDCIRATTRPLYLTSCDCPLLFFFNHVLQTEAREEWDRPARVRELRELFAAEAAANGFVATSRFAGHPAARVRCPHEPA